MRIANIVNDITSRGEEHWKESMRVLTEVHDKVRGWSVPLHHALFASVIPRIPTDGSLLICGVYRGMDLAIMRAAGLDVVTSISVVGVDLFSSEPCADWTQEQRDRGTWEAAGMGLPPSMESAQALAPAAQLVRASSIDFMNATDSRFDFIYLDTSHDYQTVWAEIKAARRILKPDGLLAGDDYGGPEHWGVRRACEELLPHHVAISSRIWISP